MGLLITPLQFKAVQTCNTSFLCESYSYAGDLWDLNYIKLSVYLVSLTKNNAV